MPSRLKGRKSKLWTPTKPNFTSELNLVVQKLPSLSRSLRLCLATIMSCLLRIYSLSSLLMLVFSNIRMHWCRHKHWKDLLANLLVLYFFCIFFFILSSVLFVTSLFLILTTLIMYHFLPRVKNILIFRSFLSLVIIASTLHCCSPFRLAFLLLSRDIELNHGPQTSLLALLTFVQFLVIFTLLPYSGLTYWSHLLKSHLDEALRHLHRIFLLYLS